MLTKSGLWPATLFTYVFRWTHKKRTAHGVYCGQSSGNAPVKMGPNPPPMRAWVSLFFPGLSFLICKISQVYKQLFYQARILTQEATGLCGKIWEDSTWRWVGGDLVVNVSYWCWLASISLTNMLHICIYKYIYILIHQEYCLRKISQILSSRIFNSNGEKKKSHDKPQGRFG